MSGGSVILAPLCAHASVRVQVGSKLKKSKSMLIADVFQRCAKSISRSLALPTPNRQSKSPRLQFEQGQAYEEREMARLALARNPKRHSTFE